MNRVLTKLIINCIVNETSKIYGKECVKMNVNNIILVVGYLIFFSCPLLFNIYKDYKNNLINDVSMSLIGLSITPELQVDIKRVFLKKRYLVRQHATNVAKYLGFPLAFILPIFALSLPNEPFIGELFLRILFGIINILIGSAFYMGSDIFFYDRKPKIKVSAEDLFSVYFKKEYPSLHSFLIPIYTNISITSSRKAFNHVNHKNMYESYNNDRYHTKNYLTRFGHNLFLFTTIFEKAILEDHSKAAFNKEISKPENIDILAKLIVFLDKPALIKQLNNETNNDSATIFNDSFEKMVSDLSENVRESHIEGKQLQILKRELEEQKAKEQLDLLVKQNFNLLKN